MHAVDLGSLANRLILQGRLAAVASLTSASTGNPALQRLELAGLDLFVALQYADRDQPVHARRPQSLAEVRGQVTRHGLAGRMELAVVDPHHSYESSRECLELGLTLLRPGGVMLVHDCLPPLELTGETFVDGDWCGVTFAAFRDVCRARGLRWFTVNADFGLGVVVAPDTPPGQPGQPGPAAPPLAETMASYERDPYAVMQVVDVADLDTALDRVAAGHDVDDLVASFPGWASALDQSTPPVPLEKRVANLQRELDTARHELGEWQRARRQLAGLRHSLPESVRFRLGRLRRGTAGP